MTASSRGRFVRYALEEGAGKQLSGGGTYVQDVPFQPTATKSQIGPHSMSLLEKRVGPLELSDHTYYPSKMQPAAWRQCSPSSRIVSSQLSSSAYSFGNHHRANFYPPHPSGLTTVRARNPNVRSPMGPVSWELSKSIPTTFKRVTSGDFTTREFMPAQFLSASPVAMKNTVQVPAFPMSCMAGSTPTGGGGGQRPARSSRTVSSPAISLGEISANFATHSPVSHQTSISANPSDHVPSPTSSRRTTSRLQRRQAASGTEVKAEPLMSLSRPLSSVRRMTSPSDYKSLMVILHDFQWTPGYLLKRGLAEDGCYHCKITLGSTLALRTRTTTLVDSVKPLKPPEESSSRLVSGFSPPNAPLLFSTVMVLPYHEENFVKIGIVKVNRVEKLTMGLCRLDTHTLIATGQDLFGGDVPMVGGDSDTIGTLKVNMAFLETAHVAAFASCAGIICPSASGPVPTPSHSRTASQVSERKKPASPLMEMSGQFHNSSLSDNSESPRPQSAEDFERPFGTTDSHPLRPVLEGSPPCQEDKAEAAGFAVFAGPQMKQSSPPGRPVKLFRKLRVQQQEDSGSSASSQQFVGAVLAESRRGRQLSLKDFADDGLEAQDDGSCSASPRSENGDVVICRVVKGPTREVPEEAVAAVQVPPVASFVAVEYPDRAYPARANPRNLVREEMAPEPARVWQISATHRVDLVAAGQQEDDSSSKKTASSKNESSSNHGSSSPPSRSWQEGVAAKRKSTRGSDTMESSRVASPVSDKMWSSIDTALNEGGLLQGYQATISPQGEERRFLERVKAVPPLRDGASKRKPSASAARVPIPDDEALIGVSSAGDLSSAESSVESSANSSKNDLLPCHPNAGSPVWSGGRSSDGEEGRSSMKSGKSWHSRASEVKDADRMPDLSLDETDSASNLSPCQRRGDGEKSGEMLEEGDDDEEVSPTQVMLTKSARDPARDFAELPRGQVRAVGGGTLRRASDSRTSYPGPLSTNLDPSAREGAQRDGDVPYFLSCQNTPSAEALLSYRFLGTNIPPLKDSFPEDESDNTSTEESPFSQKTRNRSFPFYRFRRLFSLPPHFDSFDPYDSDSKNPPVFYRRPLNRIDRPNQNEESPRPRTLLGRSRTMAQGTHTVHRARDYFSSGLDTTPQSATPESRRNTLDSPSATRVPLCAPNFVPQRSTIEAFGEEENQSISLKSTSGAGSPGGDSSNSSPPKGIHQEDATASAMPVASQNKGEPQSNNRTDLCNPPTSSHSSTEEGVADDGPPEDESPILKYSRLLDASGLRKPMTADGGCSRLLAEHEAVQSVRDEVDPAQTPSSLAPSGRNPQRTGPISSSSELNGATFEHILGSQLLSSRSSGAEEMETRQLAAKGADVLLGPKLTGEEAKRFNADAKRFDEDFASPEEFTVSRSSVVSGFRTESPKEVFDTLQQQYQRAQSLNIGQCGPTDSEEMRVSAIRKNMLRSWTLAGRTALESESESEGTSKTPLLEDEAPTEYVEVEVLDFQGTLRRGGSISPITSCFTRHGGQSISSKGGRTSDGNGSKTLEILLSFQPEGSLSQRISCRGEEDLEDTLSEVFSRRESRERTIELRKDSFDSKPAVSTPSLKISKRTVPLGASQKLAMAAEFASTDSFLDELIELPEDDKERTDAPAEDLNGGFPSEKDQSEPDEKEEAAPPVVKVAIQLCVSSGNGPDLSLRSCGRVGSLSTNRDEFSSWKDSSNVDSATTGTEESSVGPNTGDSRACRLISHTNSITSSTPAEICLGIQNLEAAVWQVQRGPAAGEEDFRETPRLVDRKEEDAASLPDEAVSLPEPDLLAVNSLSVSGEGKVFAVLKTEDHPTRLSLMSSESRSLGGLVSLRRQESLPSCMSAALSDYRLPSFVGSVDDSLEVCPTHLGLERPSKESFPPPPPIMISTPGGLSRTKNYDLTDATREDSATEGVAVTRSQPITTQTPDEAPNWVFAESPTTTTTTIPDDPHPLDDLPDPCPSHPAGPHTGPTHDDGEADSADSDAVEVVLEPDEGERVIGGPRRKDTDPSSIASSDHPSGSPKFFRRFNKFLGMRAASSQFAEVLGSDVVQLTQEAQITTEAAQLNAGGVMDAEIYRSSRGLSEDNSAVHKRASGIGFKKFWR